MRGLWRSSEDSCRKRLPVESCHRKKLIHYCFQLILLLCLALFIFGYTMSGSTYWWDTLPLDEYYQRIFNRTQEVHRPLAYHVHPSHRLKLNLTQTTTPIKEFMTTTSAPEPSTSTSESSTSTKTPDPVTTTQTVYPSTPVPTPALQFHQAFAPNYHFIIDNPDACKNNTPFLVLIVPVAPKNIEARNAIRQTWGKDSVVHGEVVLTMFMLGLAGEPGVDPQSLAQENLQHHDIIQSDFMDTYLNLTIKTMVIMNWLATRCVNTTFAMKIDSDMFLNIDNLVDMLKKPDIPRVNYLTGHLMWNRPVIRSKNSKWYVPEEMYPDVLYPTYVLGMGYVFSNDLPSKFVEISKTIKPFNIEDAYIGKCMEKLGLAPTAPPKPWQFKAYNSKYDRCEFYWVITYILGSSQQLVQYWNDLKKPGPPCGH